MEVKRITIFLIFIFVALIDYANQDIPETSEIYLTKNSFIKNQADYKSNYFVKEKYWLGWSGFSFQAQGLLRLKLNKYEYKDFLPGTIFGFKTNGIKYIYRDSFKTYIAVLTGNEMINFFVGEKEKNIYGGIAVDNIFFYSKSIGERIKYFNKENIYTDFKNSPILTTLLNLKSEIKKKDLNKDMHRRQFIKAKKIIEAYLSKSTNGMG